VVVEHSPDLIAGADWAVDLGPGGGIHGGELLFSGPLESFLDEVESPTADELRKHLRWRREPVEVVREGLSRAGNLAVERDSSFRHSHVPGTHF